MSTNMKLAKPRFAVDGALLYDAASGVSIPATGKLVEDAGTWDLAKVHDLISKDRFITEAYTSNDVITDPEREAYADAEKKLEQQNAALREELKKATTPAPEPQAKQPPPPAAAAPSKPKASEGTDANGSPTT